MYILVKSGIIAHKALKEHLKPYGYTMAKITQELCKKQERDINFTLVVDYFVIKYSLKKGRVPPHLITPIKIQGNPRLDRTTSLDNWTSQCQAM